MGKSRGSWRTWGVCGGLEDLGGTSELSWGSPHFVSPPKPQNSLSEEIANMKKLQDELLLNKVWGGLGGSGGLGDQGGPQR